MKRLFLILLSLGLVMAFSASVFAADVKFSGSFYAAGMYQDKTVFIKDEPGYPSTAFYYQRLRVKMEFIATPALKLVTRFDAMERIWGNQRSSPTGLTSFIGDIDSAGSRAENENIAFDWVYIEYASRLGVFTVGYQNDLAWGTKFGDWSRPSGKIAWAYTINGFTVMADVAKILELDTNAVNGYIPFSDGDIDKYSVAAKYAWNQGEAGLKVAYLRSAALRAIGPMATTNLYGVIPYAKAKFGPVAVEAEVDYYWGDLLDEDDGPNKIKLKSLGVYVDALADLGMWYAGGTFAYLSGDSDITSDTLKLMVGGKDWQPMLILFNYDRTYWAGVIDAPIPDFGIMYNAWFGQLRGGVRPIADLELGVSLSYAKADKKLFPGMKKDYGTEVDVTATYKITNNLSYMLGFGYLWTGKYWRADYTDLDVTDNYLVINKLTLTF
ncbi:MAG: hypothetical protein JW914_03775 [Syntrophaceae bacterium]|nr:hypothetical protein [Syntrophaceae bacterium]